MALEGDLPSEEFPSKKSSNMVCVRHINSGRLGAVPERYLRSKTEKKTVRIEVIAMHACEPCLRVRHAAWEHCLRVTSLYTSGKGAFFVDMALTMAVGSDSTALTVLMVFAKWTFWQLICIAQKSFSPRLLPILAAGVRGGYSIRAGVPQVRSRTGGWCKTV